MTTLTLRVEELVGSEIVAADFRIDLRHLDSCHVPHESLAGAVKHLRREVTQAVAAKKQGRGVADSLDARARGLREWRAKHSNADLLIASKKSDGRIIAAVYYEPEARDEAARCEFWRQLADEMAERGV